MLANAMYIGGGDRKRAGALMQEILNFAKEFLLMGDLPAADQAIPVRVRASPSLGPLAVLVDGAVVARLVPPYTGRVPVTAGRHRLEVKDEAGSVLDSVSYVVRP